MTRYIVADELRELYNEHIFDTHNDYNFAIDTLDSMPTVGAVEIIRCKDCKHRFEGEKFHNCCEVLMEMSQWLVEMPVKDDWHCGSGERKEE